jgi:hypothetical protein
VHKAKRGLVEGGTVQYELNSLVLIEKETPSLA